MRALILNLLGISRLNSWAEKRRQDALLGVKKPPLITRLVPLAIVLLFFLTALALFASAF